MASLKAKIGSLKDVLVEKLNVLFADKENKSNKKTDLSSTSDADFPNVPAVVAGINFATTKVSKPISSTTYNLVLADKDFNLKFTNTTACNVVVPLGLPADVFFQGEQRGTAAVTFSGAVAGFVAVTVQVNSTYTKQLKGQYSAFTLNTNGNNLITLSGHLEIDK